jgi:hypothetical protein
MRCLPLAADVQHKGDGTLAEKRDRLLAMALLDKLG